MDNIWWFLAGSGLTAAVYQGRAWYKASRLRTTFAKSEEDFAKYISDKKKRDAERLNTEFKKGKK